MSAMRVTCSRRLPIAVPQVVLAVASVVTISACSCLLQHSSTLLAVIGLVAAACTLLCRLAFQVVSRYGQRQIFYRRAESACRTIMGYEKLAMIVLAVTWTFTFVFEVIMDITIGNTIWDKQESQAWEVVRLLAVGLALLTTIGIWGLLETRDRSAGVEHYHDQEKTTAYCPCEAQHQRRRLSRSVSSSLLSAKPSLSTISSVTPSSSTKSSTCLKHAPCRQKYEYSPFPVIQQHSGLSNATNIPAHPKLKRVSSVPFLPPISILPPLTPPARLIANPMPALPAQAHTLRQPRYRPQLPHVQSTVSISNKTYHTKPPTLQRPLAPYSQDTPTTTVHRANMASVRRAHSSRSRTSNRSSRTSRTSRLSIMSTVQEPEHEEEDFDEVPAVPVLDVAKWADVQVQRATMRPKPRASSSIYSCRVSVPAMPFTPLLPVQPQLPPPAELRVANKREASERPLPPLPLLITKKLHVTRAVAAHPTPAPQRTRSRVSKAASIVRSKSAATARSVASARVKKSLKVKEGLYVRESALADSVSQLGDEEGENGQGQSCSGALEVKGDSGSGLGIPADLMVVNGGK